MSYIYDLLDTWNDGATTFTAVKMNVTDTASNAASLLMDLQVGSSSRFKVTKTNIIVPTVSNSTQASIGNTASANSGFYTSDGTDWGYTRAGAAMWQSGFEYFRLTQNSNFGWGTSVTSANDTILTRRGAANLRFGAADAAAPVAQTLSVQSVVAGTSNTAGANLTITGSQGTGTGAGGSIIFQVAPAGSTGTAQNGLVAALTIGSDQSVNAPGYIQTPTIADSSNASWRADGTGFGIASNKTLRFSSTSSPNGTADVILARDAPNTLALRNGTASHTFNLYGTYTSDTNYERLAISASTTGIRFASERAGAGSNRYIQFSTSAGAYFDVVEGAGLYFRSSAGNSYWQISTSGHFLAGTDNLYDIGASGATRPRNVFIGGSIVVGDGGRISRQSAFGGILFNSNNSVEFASGATPVIFNGAQDFVEMTAPAAPAANSVRIYAVDNGSGKTQLMARFATGAAQQIAIEP